MINGDDLEQRALACFTYARCVLAAGDNSSESIETAIGYLKSAETDYETVDILRSLADVQYLISVLYHNLAREDERNAYAEKQLRTEELLKQIALVFEEPWMAETWQLVSQIGATLATRRT